MNKPPPLKRGVKLFRRDFSALPRVLNADSIEAGERIETVWGEENPPVVALARDGGWWVRSEFGQYHFSKMSDGDFRGVAEMLNTRGRMRLWRGTGLVDLEAEKVEFVNSFEILGVKLTLRQHGEDSFHRGDYVILGSTEWRVSGETRGVGGALLCMNFVGFSGDAEDILDALIGEPAQDVNSEPCGLDRLLGSL